jgi:CRISP-associated protein Cas1
MRKSNPSGRGGRRRSGGDGQQELFAAQIAKAVEQAFGETGDRIAEPKPGETSMEQRGQTGKGEMAETEKGSEVLEDEGRARARTEVGEIEKGGEVLEDDGRARGRKEIGLSGAPPLPDSSLGVAGFSPGAEPLTARMMNEFVYCPRLFYYEHVDGVFVKNADTVKGSAVHARVDKGKGALPKAKTDDEKTKKAAEEGESGEGKPAGEAADGDEIHSRSVMLGSERLGMTAKMDLVEVKLDAAGVAVGVCPVDYKVGSPREGELGAGMWDTDRMQLGLQCLLLRDNGYACDAGIIYYRGTKQRVRLELTPELETWVISQIAKARTVSAGPIPPPLIDSPKCVRCSLAPVCLPDETRMLSLGVTETGEENGEQKPEGGVPRRLIASRDEKKPLYLNTQGSRVGCNGGVLKIKESRAAGKRSSRGGAESAGGEDAGASIGNDQMVAGNDRLLQEVRTMDVCHVALFGNIQISTQAVQHLCDKDIPVTWFSMGGWFYGMTRGHSLKNVLLRIEQFRHAADPASCLRLAKQFVRGKIHNHRVLFMRNHAEPPEWTKLRLGQARDDALAARSLEELLGVEGAAAAVYFQQFGGLIRERMKEEDFLEGLAPPDPAAGAAETAFTFDFTTRNRRPPTDPVNALLSLAYSLLAKECTLAACAVGLDPYVGFYHQPRHGRPALALDVMEEFRPLIAESAVFTAINNRFVSTKDFVSAGRAVNLNDGGRKQFFQCFEQRMNSLITHPVFDYKVSYRRALELQFRILARVLTGEIPEYTPFMTR